MRPQLSNDVLAPLISTIVRLPAHQPSINHATKQAKKDLERRLGRKIPRREFALLLRSL